MLHLLSGKRDQRIGWLNPAFTAYLTVIAQTSRTKASRSISYALLGHAVLKAFS